jgi:aryl-alcohol dehydrogenase-like predicted oxidoreductase
MNFRPLGAAGPLLSEIGLGCSQLGRPLVQRAPADWIRLLHRSFDLGINFYDTAGVYRHGMSERLLGQAFGDRRDKVVICTKAGSLSSPLGGLLEALPTPLQYLRRVLNNARPAKAGGGAHRQDFSPAALTRSVEASLRRLNTDRVDVLLFHSPPPEALENEESLRAMERLTEAGKVGCLGVSAESLDVACRALALPKISVLQISYSLLEPEAGENVIRQACGRGVGVIARLVLGRGLLTPKRTLSTGPRSLEGKDPARLTKIAEEMAMLADKFGRTLTETAILFALSQRGVTSALIGTNRPSHLDENISAVSAPPLSSDELRQIGDLLAINSSGPA